MTRPRQFPIGEHLDIVLGANGKTRIFVDGKEFIHCSHVLLSVSPALAGDSIDEIIEHTPPEAKILEGTRAATGIDPEVAFLAHCSNVQAWVEHDYDTRLLDSHISFGLLKELTRVGDTKARRVLQGEVASRLEHPNQRVATAIVANCGDLLDAAASEIMVQHLTNIPGIMNLPLSEAFFIAAVRSRFDAVRLSIANNWQAWTNVPVAALEILSRDPNDEIRRSLVAHHENLPPRVLEALASDPSERVRIQVGRHRNTPPAVLRQLCDDVLSVREFVASNPNTPVDLLEHLAEDTTGRIKGALACNPNLPVPLIWQLAREENYSIGIISNPNTPEDILEGYVHARRDIVREWIAKNNRVSMASLETLSNDSSPSVRTAAAQNPRLPLERLLELTKDAEVKVRIAAASNPVMCAAMLETITEHDPPARPGVAHNPNASADLLARIAREPDDDCVIWTYISEHRATQAKTLLYMANGSLSDLNEGILDNIAKHPNATPEIVDLARDKKEQWLEFFDRKLREMDEVEDIDVEINYS